MKRLIAALLIVVVSMFIFTPAATAHWDSWYWHRLMRAQQRNRAWALQNPVYANPIVRNSRGKVDYLAPGHFQHLYFRR